jgi:hypothetical protein
MIAYTYKQKKSLNEKINKIKKKSDYIKLMSIIKSDPNLKYTENNNGSFFKLHLLSDETLHKMDEFIDTIANTIIQTPTISKKYKPYDVDEFSDFRKGGGNLSKHDKGLVKRLRIDKELSSGYSEFNTDNLSDSASKHSASKHSASKHSASKRGA